MIITVCVYIYIYIVCVCFDEIVENLKDIEFLVGLIVELYF